MTDAEKLRELANYPTGSFEQMFLSGHGLSTDDLRYIADKLELLDNMPTDEEIEDIARRHTSDGADSHNDAGFLITGFIRGMIHFRDKIQGK